MAIGKKSTQKPVNMADTFAALNNAAVGVQQAPAKTQTSPVQNEVPVQTPVQPVQQNYSAPVQQTVTQQPVSSVNSLKSDGIPTVEMVEASRSAVKAEPVTSPSTEKTMISLRLLKNDKEKFQEFFKSCGLSFTDGLYMAADFIQREVENGRLQMSKSGIQYK